MEGQKAVGQCSDTRMPLGDRGEASGHMASFWTTEHPPLSRRCVPPGRGYTGPLHEHPWCWGAALQAGWAARETEILELNPRQLVLYAEWLMDVPGLP